jgi:hypothetical protein
MIMPRHPSSGQKLNVSKTNESFEKVPNSNIGDDTNKYEWDS